jgi:hypothetical protein
MRSVWTKLHPILLIASALVAFGCQPSIRSKATTVSNVLTKVPTVLSIVPPIGPPTGGTAITISGTNFDPGATVTIAGNPCTSVVVVSASEITCTTPSHNSGPVSVVVTNPTATETATQTFTYYTSAQSVPGFAVNLGGGISVGHASGNGATVHAAIGEPALGTTQVGHAGGNGVTAQSGIVNSTQSH